MIYQRAAREAKRTSRALRKQHLQNELRQAEHAYQRGDQRGLFEVMRRLAPKQRKTKVQLRGAAGRILSNAEELSVFTDYCRGLFFKGVCYWPKTLNGTWASSPSTSRSRLIPYRLRCGRYVDRLLRLS